MSTVSEKVIGCAMEVHRTLGCGFLEAVYERALAIEFRRHEIGFERQASFKISYKREPVGTYVADFLVENKLVLELKAASALTPVCRAQLLNYLHASGINVGLLINFGGTSLQIKRMVTRSNISEDLKKFV
jgi:GxxExxY protein